MDYFGIVESDEQTCFACPAQWEGRLFDGRYFYFRFRWGAASLGLSSTPDGAVADPGVVHVGYGGDLDGYLLDGEYHKLFVELYNLHEGNDEGLQAQD